MANPELPSSGNPVLVIGVGGIGCELAACCTGASVRRLLHFDAEALDAYDPAETICLAGDGGDTDDMDPEAMREAAEEAADRLAGNIEPGTGLAVLLGAIGGQTGAIVVPTLANEFKNAQCTVVVIALEPLPFEGSGRADMAAQATGELENVADVIFSVPNRPIAEVCDPSLPVGEAIATLKRKVVAAVDQLVKALTCASCVGLQPSELRRSLTDAGRGALGIGAGSGAGRVEKAIRDACANSFLTQESCQQASAAILHLLGSGDLSFQEVRSATDIVGQLVGNVPIQVGLSMDPAAADEVRATLLVTGIRRQNPNAVDDGALATLGHHQDLSFHDGVNLDVPAFLRRRPLARLHY